MNEGGKNQNIVEGFFVIFFIFAFLIFFIFRFGKNADTVNNQVFQQQEQIPETLEQKILRDGGENEIYLKYIKKILEEQQQNGTSTDISNILNDYENELEFTTMLPTQNVKLASTSNTIDRNVYLESYETSWADLQKTGAGQESQIFADQIADKETIIPLSQYDRETLKRYALEYELFAKKITSIPTPSIYEKKSVQTVENVENISYIIKQLINTTDKQVYTLWINKYTEIMFDIIANRYAN